jgi:hypothetical protein
MRLISLHWLQPAGWKNGSGCPNSVLWDIREKDVINP